MHVFQAPADNFAMEESTRLFDSTSEMFRIAMASLLAVLGVALLGGLSYHFLIFVPRIKRSKQIYISLDLGIKKNLDKLGLIFVYVLQEKWGNWGSFSVLIIVSCDTHTS